MGETATDRLPQRALRTKLVPKLRAGRIARQQLPVGTHQRVEISGRLFDHRIEVVETARPYRDGDDAAERTVGGRQPLRHLEQRGPRRLQRRGAHVADISSGVAIQLRLEIRPVGKIGAACQRRRRARRERTAGGADQGDRLHLRHDADDALQSRRQACLRGADLVVRHAAHHFADFGKDAVDGLEDFQRLLLQHVHRAIDALVGDRIDVAVVVVGGIDEQRRRKYQRRHHQQLQQTDRRIPFRAHRGPIVAAGNRRRRHAATLIRGTCQTSAARTRRSNAAFDCNFVTERTGALT